MLDSLAESVPPSVRQNRIAQLRALIDRPPTDGNVVLVTHSNIQQALAGVISEMGDAVILEPTETGGVHIAGVLRIGESLP